MAGAPWEGMWLTPRNTLVPHKLPYQISLLQVQTIWAHVGGGQKFGGHWARYVGADDPLEI